MSTQQPYEFSGNFDEKTPESVMQFLKERLPNQFKTLETLIPVLGRQHFYSQRGDTIIFLINPETRLWVMVYDKKHSNCEKTVELDIDPEKTAGAFKIFVGEWYDKINTYLDSLQNN